MGTSVRRSTLFQQALAAASSAANQNVAASGRSIVKPSAQRRPRTRSSLRGLRFPRMQSPAVPHPAPSQRRRSASPRLGGASRSPGRQQAAAGVKAEGLIASAICDALGDSRSSRHEAAGFRLDPGFGSQRQLGPGCRTRSLTEVWPGTNGRAESSACRRRGSRSTANGTGARRPLCESEPSVGGCACVCGRAVGRGSSRYWGARFPARVLQLAHPSLKASGRRARDTAVVFTSTYTRIVKRDSPNSTLLPDHAAHWFTRA